LEDVSGLIDHFSAARRKMVSYLTRIFGLGHLNLAEDVVQDALCRALEVWPVHGLPDNPSAWLEGARNRAIDLVRREELSLLRPGARLSIEAPGESTRRNAGL
jgi:RNA polymerase sigma-70 factor (ECF subfamily)